MRHIVIKKTTKLNFIGRRIHFIIVLISSTYDFSLFFNVPVYERNSLHRLKRTKTSV